MSISHLLSSIMKPWVWAVAAATNVVHLHTFFGGDMLNLQVNMSVGSENQNLTFDLDPSTSGMFINDAKLACASSNDQANQNHHCSNSFQANKSTSLVRSGLEYQTNKEKATGQFCWDHVSMDGKQVNVSFGLYNGSPWVPTLGIGLRKKETDDGFPALSVNQTVTGQLEGEGFVKSRKFSLYHGSDDDKNYEDWNLIFGGYDNNKQDNKMTTLPLTPSTSNFTFSMGAVPVKSIKLVTNSSKVPLVNGTDYQVNLNYAWSASYSLSLPHDGYKTLINGIGGKNQCADDDIVVEFDFGNVTVPIPVSALQTKIDTGCYTHVQDMNIDEGILQMGPAALHYFYAIFDPTALQATIGATVFSSESDIIEFKSSASTDQGQSEASQSTKDDSHSQSSSVASTSSNSSSSTAKNSATTLLIAPLFWMVFMI